MKAVVAILAGFLAVVPDILAAGDHPALTGGVSPAIRPLPASLDRYYPPVAERPVYLSRMLSLETSFSGIVVDLMEDDLAGAQGSFGDFRRTYEEVAAMVPEWEGAFPPDKVGELGAALAAKDKAKAMDAFAALGGVCQRCHEVAMVPVQQRYHWGDFGAVNVRDPLSGEATGYPRFKQSLAASLAGITVDLRQGQTENARKQVERFQAGFLALADSCSGCHDKARGSFVGRDMQDAVKELGQVFRSRTVVAETVSALTQKIGRESCWKCHLVHLPAAFAGRAAR